MVNRVITRAQYLGPLMLTVNTFQATLIAHIVIVEPPAFQVGTGF